MKKELKKRQGNRFAGAAVCAHKRLSRSCSSAMYILTICARAARARVAHAVVERACSTLLLALALRALHPHRHLARRRQRRMQMAHRHLARCRLRRMHMATWLRPLHRSSRFA